ncbi:MAG: hypothetical protein GVY24_03595 [Planctomycetes bacterium]|jgi:hypothetical protein|nr:hypothetical protein [Planctomycetota bacterium]
MRLTRNKLSAVVLSVAMVALAGCGSENAEGENPEARPASKHPDRDSPVQTGQATLLDTLHRTTSVSATLSATHPNGHEEKRRVRCEHLKWQGTSFTGKLSDVDKGYMKTETTRASVTGQLSPDGERLLNIAFDRKIERVTETPRGDVKRKLHTALTLTDVPLDSSNTGDRPYLRYKLKAPIDPGHADYKLTNTDSDGSIDSELPAIFLQEGDLVVHFGTL